MPKLGRSQRLSPRPIAEGRLSIRMGLEGTPPPPPRPPPPPPCPPLPKKARPEWPSMVEIRRRESREADFWGGVLGGLPKNNTPSLDPPQLSASQSPVRTPPRIVPYTASGPFLGTLKKIYSLDPPRGLGSSQGNKAAASPKPPPRRDVCRDVKMQLCVVFFRPRYSRSELPGHNMRFSPGRSCSPGGQVEAAGACAQVRPMQSLGFIGSH